MHGRCSQCDYRQPPGDYCPGLGVPSQCVLGAGSKDESDPCGRYGGGGYGAAETSGAALVRSVSCQCALNAALYIAALRPSSQLRIIDTMA